ncbi:hypothetical protein BMS3Abin15_00016 [bacterium BMS3Abin15]|nr:hypothetical protein BMS3Abin15_00016 [bacterium BMS3Abin15]HEW78836.1 hypothetical protein [Phycisphaerales bacterium]
MEEHSLNSSFREKLIEHLFVGELLKLSWINKDYSLEVSKPEVDNSGYDLIIEAQGILRHIQLKAAFVGAKTSRQNIHVSLADKQSGCVVWVYFDKNNLALGPYLFFGGKPGEPLPDLSNLKIAKHTKGDADGFKAERPNIRTINKGSFTIYETIEALYHALFK